MPMHEPNRECQVCGRAYYFCNCHFNSDKHHWKMNCCDPMHYQVFIVALDLRDGVISADEARERLSNIGFSAKDLSWCIPSIAEILSVAFPKKTAKAAKKATVEGE